MAKRSDSSQVTGGESAGARALRGIEGVARFVRASELLARAADAARAAGRVLRTITHERDARWGAGRGDATGGGSVDAAGRRGGTELHRSRATSLDISRVLGGFVAAVRGARAWAGIEERARLADSALIKVDPERTRSGSAAASASRGIDAARYIGRQTVAGIAAVERSRTPANAIERGTSIGAAAKRIERSALNVSGKRGETLQLAMRSRAVGTDGVASANRAFARSQSIAAVSDKLSRAVGAVTPNTAAKIGVEARNRSTIAAMAQAMNGRARAATAIHSAVVASALQASPKFADLPTRGPNRELRGGAGAVTINSSPTVVVNAGEGRGDIEREVMSALRAHREELFDSFRREATRRERAQF